MVGPNLVAVNEELEELRKQIEDEIGRNKVSAAVKYLWLLQLAYAIEQHIVNGCPMLNATVHRINI